MVAYLLGTDGSNPFPSSGESQERTSVGRLPDRIALHHDVADVEPDAARSTAAPAPVPDTSVIERCNGVIADRSVGRRAAIAWNILGLGDFAVAITLGAITSPGPFQLIVPDVPSIGAGDYPGVLTPAFVVPSSILLHALSLRQLIRRRAG